MSDAAHPLTDDEKAAMLRALSYGNGRGYDGAGPDDVFEPIEILEVSADAGSR